MKNVIAQKPVSLFWVTPIPFEIENLDAGAECNLPRGIGAAGVHDNHILKRMANSLKAFGQVFRFVQDRNADGDRQFHFRRKIRIMDLAKKGSRPTRKTRSQIIPFSANNRVSDFTDQNLIWP